MRHTISRATETEKQELPELGLVARKLREAALRRAISREKEAEKQEKMDRWKARAAILDPDNPNFTPLGRKRR